MIHHNYLANLVVYERQGIYHDVTHSEAIHSEIISFVAYGDDFNDSDNVL